MRRGGIKNPQAVGLMDRRTDISTNRRTLDQRDGGSTQRYVLFRLNDALLFGMDRIITALVARFFLIFFRVCYLRKCLHLGHVPRAGVDPFRRVRYHCQVCGRVSRRRSLQRTRRHSPGFLRFLHLGHGAIA